MNIYVSYVGLLNMIVEINVGEYHWYFLRVRHDKEAAVSWQWVEVKAAALAACVQASSAQSFGSCWSFWRGGCRSCSPGSTSSCCRSAPAASHATPSRRRCWRWSSCPRHAPRTWSPWSRCVENERAATTRHDCCSLGLYNTCVLPAKLGSFLEVQYSSK